MVCAMWASTCSKSAIKALVTIMVSWLFGVFIVEFDEVFVHMACFKTSGKFAFKRNNQNIRITSMAIL